MDMDILDKMKDMDPFDFFGMPAYDCKIDMEDPEEYNRRLTNKYTQFVRLVIKKFQDGELDEKGLAERLSVIDEMFKKVESAEARFLYEEGKTDIYLRNRFKKPEDREF